MLKTQASPGRDNGTTAGALMSALAVKDRDIYEHSKRVAARAQELACRIGIGSRAREALWVAGLLHDIGKVGISDTILHKKDKLTVAEPQAIRTHPMLSFQVAAHVRSNRPEVSQAVLHHHERYDGRGYPDRLAGEAIPMGARILAVADAWDAMTSGRPYRAAMPSEAAVDELVANKGRQFDPELVDVFIDMVREDGPGAGWTK